MHHIKISGCPTFENAIQAELTCDLVQEYAHRLQLSVGMLTLTPAADYYYSVFERGVGNVHAK